jgi:hypothetical protein
MINRKVGEITEADLVALITDSVCEGRTLDYKEQMNISRDEDKKEFLADLSSFSNASGGDLIIGVCESEGLPKELIGLTVSDTDTEQLRVEQLIRDGIQPRVVGVEFQWVNLSNSKKVLVIRAPRSWNSPHRVTYKGHDKFYGRSSAGKYPLDVTELRTAFNRSASIADQIKRFRMDRISAVIAGETPLPFVTTSKIVIHLIPLASFEAGHSMDLKKIYQRKPSPIAAAGWDVRYNFDGVLSYSAASAMCSTYTQYFRNAIIEGVDGRTLNPTSTAGGNSSATIPSSDMEGKVEKFVSTQLDILKDAGISTPICVFVTLIGVSGYRMAYSDQSGQSRVTDASYAISRDVLMMPEIIVDDYTVDIRRDLRPVFDAVWNACGLEGRSGRAKN